MPKIIDLFAGAGGLSLGAARAGFELAAAVELDSEALATHKRNFPKSLHFASDVSALRGPALLTESGVRPGELAGLIGGPPCQGFSAIGSRSVDDLRNDLFAHFFRLVNETRPAFFIAENVPGVLNPRYQGILRSAAALLPRSYRALAPIEVQANLYGAPTLRRRVFFVGYLPARFKRDLTAEDFRPNKAHTRPVTVAKALKGLPMRIDARWQSEALGWRPVGKLGLSVFAERVTNAIPASVGDLKALERYLGSGLVSGCLGTLHSDELRRRYAALAYGEKDL